MNFLLLTAWDGLADLSGWLVSEKLDGHRVMWTGDRFVSRGGFTVKAPAWFFAGLPSIALDGELYCGTDHNEVQSIVSDSSDPRWSRMRFCAFDAPSVAGPFTTRAASIPALLAGCAFAVAVEHLPITSASDALDRMRAVVAGGGEGVVARDPAALYVEGRADSVVKIKPGEGDGTKRRARRASAPFTFALEGLTWNV